MVAEGKENAAQAHASNSDLVLEAAIFEIVTHNVEKLLIPDWVFVAFGRPPSIPPRTFNYLAMLFPDGSWVNQWGPGASVPDMRQAETQMWFLYAGATYIDAGIEALHLGQIQLMSSKDTGMLQTWNVFNQLRLYASKHARRGFVLLNAHLYSDPFAHFNKSQQLILDFHAFPSRPFPILSSRGECTLKVGFSDSMYQKSAGGISVSGWLTKSLPYLVELDNYGCTNHPGSQDPLDLFHPFGYDEITWYAHQNASYRNSWLPYAAAWVRALPIPDQGYLMMPGMRVLCESSFVDRPPSSFYYASAAVPEGFAQEDAIIDAFHVNAGNKMGF
jgi:hypothetical protein